MCPDCASRAGAATPGRSAYLGVDLGTSGLKLALVSEGGMVIAEAEASYDVASPQPGQAETAPADWEEALREAASDVKAKLAAESSEVAVAALGVTGQMHGVVLADADGMPLRPAVLWPDRRATLGLEEWRKLSPKVRGRLANPVVAGMAGPILSWLRQHEPDCLTAAAQVRSPKDWLRSRLTGDLVTERSDASATLLWDVVGEAWSADAVGLAGISAAQLPDVVRSDSVVAEATGFPELGKQRDTGSSGIPVVAGGADVACVLTAISAARLGPPCRDTLVVNVGTGIQILRPDADVVVRPASAVHLYADTDGGWYEMVAGQNGGSALRWVQQTLEMDWDQFLAAACSAPAGSRGATFVPFLTGERGGVAAEAATGGWQGLTHSVSRAELARSALEAMAFTIRRGIGLLGAHDCRVLLTGGGAREPAVRQLIADVLGRPLEYVGLRSASAVGAAVLAARGTGSRLPVCASTASVEPVSQPALEDAYVIWERCCATD